MISYAVLLRKVIHAVRLNSVAVLADHRWDFDGADEAPE